MDRAALVVILLLFIPGESRALEDMPEIVEGIVYSSLRPENLDLYLIEEDGGDPARLTDHPALDYNPTFSPDGRWIVFTSERTGNPELWALELDQGNQPVQLTRHQAMDDAAGFSPDGRTLVFVSTREGNADLYVMPFDPENPEAESKARNLTQRPGGDFNPAFSPDGRWIAYSRQDKLWPDSTPENRVFDANGADLYIMAADGSGVRELVGQVPGPEVEPGIPFGSVAGSPSWSADGANIYYHLVSKRGREIRKVRPDGTEDRLVAAEALSPTVMTEGRVVFSRPDVTRELDALDVLTTGRLVSADADGSERYESTGSVELFAPDFDARSRRIVAHGPGAVEGHVGEQGEGFLFAPPGGRNRVRLGDRELALWAVRGFFPALTAQGDVISTLLDDGSLSRTPIDGASRERIFEQDGFAWGAAVAREAGVIVAAAGPMFAPGSEEVDLWIWPLDGGTPNNLTSEVSANDALPHIALDGNRIVFRSGGDGGVGRVLSVDRNGGQRHRLTDFNAAETMPAVSPDGEWVVFTTNRVGGWKLWIQRFDGSGGRFLEPSRLDIPDTSMHPRFSPDGEWVVFTSDRGGFNDEWPLTPFPQPYGDLWAVSLADGVAVRLTHNKWEDGPNDWGPIRNPKKGL